jgi:hypothetical protein
MKNVQISFDEDLLIKFDKYATASQLYGRPSKLGSGRQK